MLSSLPRVRLRRQVASSFLTLATGVGVGLGVGLGVALGVTPSAAAGTVLFVDADATPGGDGATWATAFSSLNAAIAASQATGASELWIAEGLYLPTGASNPRESTFALFDGLALYGGFNGTSWRERIAIGWPTPPCSMANWATPGP